MSGDTFVFPTSFAQRRLWFIHQLEPASALYHVPMVRRLRGALNVAALGRALETIVARHEALRTTFIVSNGEPMQRIATAQPRSLPLADLSGVPEAERDGELQHRVHEAIREPFDLERGPLIRAGLFRLAPEDHVLVVVVHHIVFDGWSAGVLTRELTTCYKAFAADEAPDLPKLPVQYADYTVWQREWLSGDVLERQLGYWRTHLSGVPTVLDLPTDFTRPRRGSHRGAAESVIIAAAVRDGLKRLSQDEGATLFMTLLAAFQAVLGQHSGQDDFLVGSPIANRSRPELEPLIGFFVNSLVLRADLKGDPTFRELLGRVRETALAAYAHQDVPFERLVEELQPERDADRNPLFQVMFSLQNAPQARLALPGVALRPVSANGRTAKFDLTLTTGVQGDGLWARLEYRTDLFESGTARRILAHFERLLRAVASDPDRHLSQISLLDAPERTRAVVEWNQTRREFPATTGLQALFEERVASQPTAIALEWGTQRVTYTELNRRANRLAAYLRRKGVGPEARVGIALDRSIDFVVAVLAGIKAGAAYVPLDPTYPAERLAFMCRDAGVSLVLNAGAPPTGLPAGIRGVDLLADRVAIAAESDANPISGSQPDALAYVMYTSGSTGQPKGIGIPHRAIARLVCNTDYVRLDPTDCVAQISNASFDAATFEVWGALLNGARLAVLDRDVVLAPRVLARELRARGVTTLFMTTALFNQLTRQVPDLFASLRQVLFGGEASDPERVRAVLRDGGPARLLHVYGPTETTTFATWHHVQSVPDNARSVPIGRPIANTSAYVLGPGMEPVPIGVPGELYIGGPGVALGYVGRPALTAERFVPDPFGPPGGRLYRTGDRVRQHADGTIEFLGRFDTQVKLRGFRVEPGEIESALAGHASVRECAVLLRADLPRGPSLVAYVVPRAEPGNSADLIGDLRSYLSGRLPEFMMPSEFVVLSRLPLSPNGKVDRHALPTPVAAPSVRRRHADRPLTAVERKLTALWESALRVDGIDLDDNFFEVGGHSLLAVSLFAEIEAAFGRKVPLSSLFHAPTIRQLAEVLSRPTSNGSLVAVRPGSDGNPPLFVIHGVSGNVLEYHSLVSRLAPDQPVYGCELPGERWSHLRSVEQLAAHHVASIRRVQPKGPYFLCGFCWAGRTAFEIACQLRAMGESVGLLALIDSPFQDESPSTPQQMRWFWRSVYRNLRRLGGTDVRKTPRFLWQRGVNIVTRTVGTVAFRWSVRVGRPLLPRFRQAGDTLYLAGRAYQPRRYPGRVTLLRASGGSSRGQVDLFSGWARACDGGVEVHDIPGGHQSIMREPNVDALSRELQRCLLQARGDDGWKARPTSSTAPAFHARDPMEHQAT